MRHSRCTNQESRVTNLPAGCREGHESRHPRLPALHPPLILSRLGRPRNSPERQPRRNPPLAPRPSPRKNQAQPPGPPRSADLDQQRRRRERITLTAFTRISIELFQLREFRFGLAQDRHVKIRVFPQSEELLIGLARR